MSVLGRRRRQEAEEAEEEEEKEIQMMCTHNKMLCNTQTPFHQCADIQNTPTKVCAHPKHTHKSVLTLLSHATHPQPCAHIQHTHMSVRACNIHSRVYIHS